MRAMLLSACCVVAMCPAVVAAQEPLVRIGAEDCRRLVRHVPDADVAYRPGVDVRGRPVAPADLGGGWQLNLPAEIAVPVTIDLARRYGLEPPVAAETPLGVVTVRDGQALFNGQPMSDFDQNLIAEACRAQGLR